MNISVIGGGVMGSIIAEAISKQFKNINLVVSDHNPKKITFLKKSCKNVFITNNNVEAIKDAKIIILAIKPQSFGEFSREVKGQFNNKQLVISIMAGVKIKTIKKKLSVGKVVRAMPNLGAKINQSMTVWTANKEVDKSSKKFVEKIFKAFGEQMFVQNENMIDAATAVSGSGPGFFFYLIEEWQKAAEKIGFNKAEARKLVEQTVMAASNLLKTGLNAEIMRKQVTSKAGTTEAGLNKMKQYAKEMWINTLKYSHQRAKELAK